MYGVYKIHDARWLEQRTLAMEAAKLQRQVLSASLKDKPKGGEGSRGARRASFYLPSQLSETLESSRRRSAYGHAGTLSVIRGNNGYPFQDGDPKFEDKIRLGAADLIYPSAKPRKR